MRWLQVIKTGTHQTDNSWLFVSAMHLTQGYKLQSQSQSNKNKLFSLSTLFPQSVSLYFVHKFIKKESSTHKRCLVFQLCKKELDVTTNWETMCISNNTMYLQTRIHKNVHTLQFHVNIFANTKKTIHTKTQCCTSSVTPWMGTWWIKYIFYKGIDR